MSKQGLSFRSRRRRAVGLRYGLISFAVALTTAAVALATASIGLSVPAARAHGSRLQISAMTYNLFQGTELTNTARARTLAALLAAVPEDYGQVQATDFPERARAIAREAARSKPDLIGLQEAALWQTGTPSASLSPPPATAVAYDFVQILVDALNARGLHYAAVAVTRNASVQAPGRYPSGFMNVRLTDRVAILARTDVPLTISDVRAGNFTHNTVISTLAGPLVVLGGWASADATLGGHTVRFVTTHLDASSGTVRTAQAAELVRGPLSTALPVMLTCDCNAVPASPPYAVLAAAGLKDSWRESEPATPGFTCCHPSLLSPASVLPLRVDYVFSRGGGLKAVADQIVGTDPADRSSPSGFWPSDHAGLFAELAQGSG
jgi:endonuclease/exonuclease/phosphatase family metal-dependent hydrolase